MPTNSLQLPTNVSNYLYTNTSTDHNLEICKKHGLSKVNIGQHTDIVIDLYYKNLPLTNLIKEIEQKLNLNTTKAQELAKDIAGIKLLPISDWLQEDVKTYITNLSGNPEDYNKYQEELNASIKKEKDEEQLTLIEEQAKSQQPKKEPTPPPTPSLPTPPSIHEEKEACKDLFQNNLLSLLQPNNEDFIEIIKDFNFNIIDWLDGDTLFQNSLIKSLYKNQEKLSHKTFTLNGKPNAPTISNWLRDLIKQYGTSNLNDISLTRFVTDSPNARNINKDERETLSNLLKLYRTLKFFPDSLTEDTPENWAIIPIKKSYRTTIQSEITEGRKPLAIPTDSIPPTQTEPKIKPATQDPITTVHPETEGPQTETSPPASQPQTPEDLEKYMTQAESKPPTTPATPQTQPPTTPTTTQNPTPTTPTPPKPTPPLSSVSIRTQKPTPTQPPKPRSENPRINELSDMANMYQKNSLERKAIEDEIKKLEK